MLLTVVVGVQAQTMSANLSGGGTKDNPWLIGSENDWNKLASDINDGRLTYYNQYVKLTNDIEVTYAMLGISEGRSFQGIFDGNGHTLTFNFTSNAEYCAPFRYVLGATIKNLHTAGTINTSNRFAGGIVGRVCVPQSNTGATYTTTILNCRSSVEINSTYNGDGSHSGVVSIFASGTLNIVNTVFDGKLIGSKTYSWGGFIAWLEHYQTANLTNCVFNPSVVTVKDQSNSEEGRRNCTFSRKHSNGTLNIDNCLYFKAMMTRQGTAAEIHSSSDYDKYREQLGDAFEVVNYKIIPYMALRSFSGGDGSASSPYLIASRADWESLAINVLLEQSYSGKYFKLTKDITIAYAGEDRFFMVGSAMKINASTTDMRRFEGIFDGDGHTLTFDFRRRDWGSGNSLSFNQDYCAPFRYINNATIRNLKLTGSISTTQKYAAGLVAQASGSNSITNCRSSINITGTKILSENGQVTLPPYHGGFVANVQSGTTKIEGCLFDGQFHQEGSPNNPNCSGFVGSSSGTVNVSNSLVYPASVDVQGGRTFVYSDNNNATVNNCCYFSQKIGGEQGKQLRRITAITGINMAPANTPTVYGVSGIAIYDPGIKYNDVFYAGKGDAVSLNLSAASGYIQTGSFTAAGGTVSGSASPYTLTLNNNTDDVTVNGGVVQSDWAGSGTQADPFQIKTTQDLDQLATNVNNGTSYAGFYFKVMNDIAYTYTSAWNDNTNSENNYTRIGYYFNNGASILEDRTFRGHFDGNGKTISGIRCVKLGTTGQNDAKIGLFGTVGPGGEVKGVTLTDCRFTGYDDVGGIAGFNCLGVITDCHVTNTVSIHAVQKSTAHGGIVGYCGYYASGISGTGGEVSYCTSAATITYTYGASDPYFQYFGGIAGRNANGHILRDNVVIGATIKGTSYYGAIVGDNSSEGILQRNYYKACTVGDSPTAEGVGQGGTSSGGPSDVTENDGARPTEHTGTAGDPYIISTVAEWNELADHVAGTNGLTQNGFYRRYFKLSDTWDNRNEPITRMIGTDGNHAFCGTFDGNGKTLTVNLTATSDFCGPFAYTYGATIKNLHTTGTINTSNRHAGGVVGRNGTASLTLANVSSSVAITSTVEGEALHGGLVGYAINATIEGCAFTGRLLGASSYRCGGLLGWKSNTENTSALITNCFFDPAEVTVGLTNSRAFAGGTTGSVISLGSCYYKNDCFGPLQGKPAYSITKGNNITTFEVYGTPTQYDVSGITVYADNKCVLYNGVLYAGKDDEVKLQLDNNYSVGEGEDNVVGYSYSTSAGDIAIGPDGNPCVFFMPSENTTISAGPVPPGLANTGNGTAESPYVISSVTHWYQLAAAISKGVQGMASAHYKLGADISVKAMVGQEDHPFQGHFDGNGKILTVDYQTNEENTAPFRYIDGATICNLHVAGSILVSYADGAAGIVGKATGTNTITNCRCSAEIAASNSYNSGLVSTVASGSTTISGCRFDGKLQGASAKNSAGFVAAGSPTALTIENCLFDPAELTMRKSTDSGSHTFTRCSGATVSNSYYTQPFGTAQGKESLYILAGRNVTLSVSLLGTTQTYDVSGITASASGGMRCDDKLYVAKNDQVSLTLGYTGETVQGYDVAFEASYATLDGTDNPYTLTMGDEGTTINYVFADANWTGSGTEADPYMIYTPYQLDLLARRVNEGEWYYGSYFKLGADIAYRHTTSWDNDLSTENNFTSIGYYDVYLHREEPTEYVNAPFAGTFDGDGHKISGIRIYQPLKHYTDGWEETVEVIVQHWDYNGHSDIDNYWEEIVYENVWREETKEVSQAYGIFGYVIGEVKNVVVDDVRIASPKQAGALVGKLTGTVSNCHITSHVTVAVSSESSGGEVQQGGIAGSGSSIYNSTSAVQMSRPSGNMKGDFGAIVGYADGGTLSGNMAFGAIVPNSGRSSHGAIAGSRNYTSLQNNYYFACNVAGTANATNMGCAGANVTQNDGAVSGISLYDKPAKSDLYTDIMNKAGNANIPLTLQGRTLYKDGDWNTFCLPFAVSNFSGTPLEGATVKAFDGSTSAFDNKTGTLTLNFTDATAIEAGQPYLVKYSTKTTGGTDSNNNLYKLTDGDTTTKWCARNDTEKKWYAEFTTATPMSVTGYTMTTANDASAYTMRNPKVWTLQAKLNANDEWTTIDSRNVNDTPSDALPATNFTDKRYDVATSGTYQYFLLDITQNGGGEGNNGWWVQLSEIKINGTSQDAINPVFTGVNISSSSPVAVSSSDGKVSFTGTYTPMSFGAEDKSILFLGGNNTLYYPETGASINAFRAYFQLNGITAGDPVNGIRAFVLNFGDDEQTQGVTTPLSNRRGAGGEASEPWFSLDGRRLSGKPTKAGLYIVNGNKVVVK